MNTSDPEWRSWTDYSAAATLLVREIDAVLIDQHDLTMHDLHILHRLNTNPGRYGRMGALAEILVCAPSRVTGLVQRLEDRGLVLRGRSQADRRVVIVGITRKGQDHLRPALHTYAALVRRYYLKPLTRGQMTALGDSAGRVGDGLKHRGAD